MRRPYLLGAYIRATTHQSACLEARLVVKGPFGAILNLISVSVKSYFRAVERRSVWRYSTLRVALENEERRACDLAFLDVLENC